MAHLFSHGQHEREDLVDHSRSYECVQCHHVFSGELWNLGDWSVFGAFFCCSRECAVAYAEKSGKPLWIDDENCEVWIE